MKTSCELEYSSDLFPGPFHNFRFENKSIDLSMASSKKSKKNISVHIKKRKPKPTHVYRTYWKFAKERQDIFFKRLDGELPPWSNDAIFGGYKFTNVYRACDRVSQYLIRNVIYDKDRESADVFFRIMLFKIFNRISTWEFIQAEVGEINLRSYSFATFSKLLNELLNSDERIYSAAYIMASGKEAFGYDRKHQNHLRLIEQMIETDVPNRLQECDSMASAYELLLSYPTIGSFLAYQYATDINYSKLTNFSETEFVKAGPGARGGISKCFSDIGDYSPENIIEMMADNQESEFDKLGLAFKTLFGRPMQLIDCQNVFCEVDKYARAAHPEVSSESGRTRIKQKFKWEDKSSIDFFFPPKWKLNDKLKNYG